MGSIAQGNHADFAQLYERTHLHLFGIAMRILGNGQSAEDVLQEAYVSIWKNAAGYRSEVGGQAIQPMTWLIAIVRNKALDALRARTRRKEDELAQDGTLAEDSPEVAGSVGTSASAAQLLEQSSQCCTSKAA